MVESIASAVRHGTRYRKCLLPWRSPCQQTTCIFSAMAVIGARELSAGIARNQVQCIKPQMRLLNLSGATPSYTALSIVVGKILIDYRGQKEENNYVRRAMTRAVMTQLQLRYRRNGFFFSGCKYCSQWLTLGLSKYQGWFHTCTVAHQRWLPSPIPTATYPDDTSNLQHD